MASLIVRRPIIGIAAGFLFGSLGLMLLYIDAGARGSTPLAAVLFKVMGGFLLFVALLSVLNSVHALLRRSRIRKPR